MNIIIFCLPVIISIFLLIFFHKKVTFWEYALLIVPSLLISFFIEFCMKEFNTNDTEYLGYYVTKVSHYDKWNEYVHKTCTRRVRVGKNHYVTRTYDCSYVRTHPERWEMTLNDNSTLDCSEEKFNKIVKKFNTPQIFRDMHRRYHTIDGDAQDYMWNNKIEQLEAVTKEHSYENRLQSSKTIFQFENISKKDAEDYGLLDYPEVENDYQKCILGLNLGKSQTQYIDALNAMYGKDRQIRIYMLFFKDKSPEITEYQRSYWQGGNKNELVLCLGFDTTTKKITWCEGFSWSDVPLLEGKAKEYFLSHPYVNMKAFSEYITPYIKVGWNRKSFDDFKYINVELSMTQYIWCFILTMLYCIGISIYIVRNEYQN